MAQVLDRIPYAKPTTHSRRRLTTILTKVRSFIFPPLAPFCLCCALGVTTSGADRAIVFGWITRAGRYFRLWTGKTSFCDLASN